VVWVWSTVAAAATTAAAAMWRWQLRRHHVVAEIFSKVDTAKVLARLTVGNRPREKE
jgi:hypothetical protein